MPRCDASGRSPCFAMRPLGGTYAYLLGLYLGDGCLALGRRGVWHLRLTLDSRYPAIIARARAAIADVRGREPGVTRRTGCVDVSSYSKHWRCAFPQHGRGEKHLRDVSLRPWQTALVERAPDAFLAGLIHSDGCRCLNRVNGQAYPRYFFSNRSPQIRSMFEDACALVGVDSRPAGRWNISVARRESVQRLDQLVGPKA